MPTNDGEPDLYMPLEIARREDWTLKHQPSLIANAQRTVNHAVARHGNDKAPHSRDQSVFAQDFRKKSITHAYARGFVTCGDWDKARVSYSDTAPRRMVPLVVNER